MVEEQGVATVTKMCVVITVIKNPRNGSMMNKACLTSQSMFGE